MEEQMEIVEHPDGTSTIRVVRSKRPCGDVSRPFEQATGEVVSRTVCANPGQVQGKGQEIGRKA